MDIEIGGTIDKVNAKGLSYEEFVKRYMEKNQPVVLTGLMDNWRACKDWVDENGQPNLQFFSTHFGKSRVQVADCCIREFTDQKRVEMSVAEFIEQWCKDSGQDHNFALNGLIQKSVLYLKDWHFVKEYPNYTAYSTPHFVCDDWLNLYLDSYRIHKDPDSYQGKDEISCSDYRFVYMGAKGSWTPLHADVFRSYSWSANVCGKKQWFLLSPSQCHLVFDRNMKSCIYNIFDNISENLFPGFKEATWLECTQEQNEIIFVPSGWYHQVSNLEDTISINHNWFNSYNLCWVLDLISRDYNEAKEYIEDIRDICDDFEGLCQRNLAANTGMNFYDFFIFLARFSLANLVLLDNLARDTENATRRSSPMAQQLALNLASIQKITLKMKSMESFSGNRVLVLDFGETHEDPKFLQLCESLLETYGTIHEQQCSSFCMKTITMHDSRMSSLTGNFCDHVCSPQDLVKFIDNFLTKHGSLCE